MTKSYVKTNYCIGFVSDKGLMLDLDNCTLKKADCIAKAVCHTNKLNGYLLIKSSHNNYHTVFDKYLRWKTITKILFNQYICIRWAIWQMKKGELTLRVSEKNKKNRPKIIKHYGTKKQLIKDYLTTYTKFNNPYTQQERQKVA